MLGTLEGVAGGHSAPGLGVPSLLLLPPSLGSVVGVGRAGDRQGGFVALWPLTAPVGTIFPGAVPCCLASGHLWLGVSPAEPGPWSQGVCSWARPSALQPLPSSLSALTPTALTTPRSPCSSPSVCITDWTRVGPNSLLFSFGHRDAGVLDV